MEKLNVHVRLHKDLQHGALIWIYANNERIYHSSKRFDTVEFNEHDSNFLGKLKDIHFRKRENRSLIIDMLTKYERIFGICTSQKPNNSGETEIIFFSSLEDVEEFSETFFRNYDQLEMKRKEAAKREWKERGKRFLNNKTHQNMLKS